MWIWEDMKQRMIFVAAMLYGLHHIWGDAELSRDFRVQLIVVRILSTLLYDMRLGTWTVLV